MNLWPASRSCIIPLVATGPTPNTLNTQFPPNSPNCQPSMGIWEHLANQLEHSYETGARLTQKQRLSVNIPFPLVRRHAQGGPGPTPFSGEVCRDIWLSSFSNFPLGLLVQWASHHRWRRSILQE